LSSFREAKSPPAPQADAICRALRLAAERAAERLATGAASSVREELRQLAEALCVLVTAERKASASFDVPRVASRLVEAYRLDFLACMEEVGPKRPTGTTLLTLMAAIEHAGSMPDRRRSGEFSERLGSSEVLEGMVEIAHDMRSPLGAILLLVEPIRKGQNGPVTPVQERQLALIYAAALSLSTLANDIIDAARGTRRMESRSRPFSISGTIEAACAVVRPIAEEKQIELHQTHPDSDGRIGDSGAIRRVLLNLATNALKYTTHGSVHVGCRELGGDAVEFWVKDTGPGIPDHVMVTLFDGFRPSGDGMRFSSSGLGLSICRTLLKSMGASLRVATAIGEGTQFSFVLDLPRAQTP
jgi:signal transduction histidine kinase